MGKPLDLAGKTFGYLTAIEPTNERKNGMIVWHFKCECGNDFYATGTSVKTGNTKSCGCHKYDGLMQYNKENSEIAKIELGTRFGKLVVIEDLGIKNPINGHGRRYYKCKCDCGNYTEASGNQLKANGLVSCGCQGSKGEEIIKKILIDNNILFRYDCPLDKLTEDTGHRLRFDFIIYDDKGNIIRCIEFDGEQHIRGMVGGIWSHSESLEKIQERDNIKNQWCKENNIPLARIPYYRMNGLTITKLLDDTFLI